MKWKQKFAPTRCRKCNGKPLRKGTKLCEGCYQQAKARLLKGVKERGND